MNGAKEFLLVCVVFLVISCLTSAQPAGTERTSEYRQWGWFPLTFGQWQLQSFPIELSDVYDEPRIKEQATETGDANDVVNLHNDEDSKNSPRVGRSVKYMPYLVSSLAHKIDRSNHLLSVKIYNRF